ncbi:tyrosine-protein phosphatase [Yinghuangia soli]|uniref:Tyrosine-protein phosphatase n=1 Tax=Yinghuangia soli TaxID=2908204 RepID=A0AA41U980_9ACTN|nr:tyrosine-protein phosphatase [Yinghuangia soli]MCF2533609.1 tyrosine-protein phosphatase [Yinghuangia soli]
MTTDDARRPGIDHVDNLRDAGGYPTEDGRTVRLRTLLRSGDLSRLDDAGRAEFNRIGLRTVLDLRDRDEAKTAPDAVDGLDAVYVANPVFDGDLPTDPATTLAALYRYTVDHHRDGLASAIRFLAAPGALPADVHCTAGKDRTGLVIALALTVAGVDRDRIVADYALSHHYLGDEFRARVQRQLAGWAGDASSAAVAMDLAIDSPAQAMRDTLEHVDHTYGSVAAYLEAAGVTAAVQQALRDTLTAPTTT